MKSIRKQMILRDAVVDREAFTIRGVFSTAAEDRHGEVVSQDGWDLAGFKDNPVILFAHDAYQPAVARCVEIAVTDGKLQGAIQFAAEQYEFAATLFELYAGGFMRAFSVGFRNLEYTVDQETDVLTYVKNLLLEISCVNIPANAEALAEQKGIDVSPIARARELAARTEDVRKAEAERATTAPEAKGDTVEEDKPDHAVELAKADEETIARAITTLTGALKERRKADTATAGNGRKVEQPAEAGRKGIPVSVINAAVKELLAEKASNK